MLVKRKRGAKQKPEVRFRPLSLAAFLVLLMVANLPPAFLLKHLPSLSFQKETEIIHPEFSFL